MKSDSRADVAETAALVAFLRATGQPPPNCADRLEEAASARAILEDEHGLLAPQLLQEAATDIQRWDERGIRLITLLDADYPQNLRAVYDRPPLLFVRGNLHSGDTRSVAVIGSRRASSAGRDRACAITECLIEARYTVVSGLAAGIDTVAHETALSRGARTIAVVGTGLDHAYPPQNAALQQRVALRGAVVSQFWPEAGPSRQSFPVRNAVMSGLTLATFVVEATRTSGARTQIRAALAHGRPVLLAPALMDQAWAREVATRPGVEVIRSPAELRDVMERISSTDTLVA